jgi:hypothetical protein
MSDIDDSKYSPYTFGWRGPRVQRYPPSNSSEDSRPSTWPWLPVPPFPWVSPSPTMPTDPAAREPADIPGWPGAKRLPYNPPAPTLPNPNYEFPPANSPDPLAPRNGAPPNRSEYPAPSGQATRMAQNLTAHVLRMKGVPEADIGAAINDPAQMRNLLNQLYGSGR